MAIAHPQAIYDYILQLVQAAEIANPEAVAEQLLLLVEGAIVVAMMRQSPAAATLIQMA
ncbi:hypothetical protein [Lyngbya confervoides]|uniref:TetR family transcriptional regulator n=1 Tax=Lyngbya confervoides BDU141951 TaxID=1574623 RepID=A0ABD4T168_9CYAN|nr:hypothetical protein [Lyngbya confervoides]MCM1982279.1 hypothetical protein [Lyngbya confervoides BDU141951]